MKESDLWLPPNAQHAIRQTLNMLILPSNRISGLPPFGRRGEGTWWLFTRHVNVQTPQSPRFRCLRLTDNMTFGCVGGPMRDCSHTNTSSCTLGVERDTQDTSPKEANRKRDTQDNPTSAFEDPKPHAAGRDPVWTHGGDTLPKVGSPAPRTL